MHSLPLSYFRNIYSCTSVCLELGQVLRHIEHGTYAAKVQAIREASFGYDAQSLKLELPAVLFGARVNGTGRKSADITGYNPLVCLDIDAKDNQGRKFSELRTKLRENPYVLAFFASPRGQGLKILVRIAQPEKEWHWRTGALQVYEFFRSLYYGLNIDPQSKVALGMCSLSYDPEMYINWEAEAFDYDMSENSFAQSSNRGYAGRNDLQIDAPEFDNLDGMVENYEDWVRVGFALATEMGEAGRAIFHKISSQSHNYNPTSCDSTYNRILRNNRGQITAGTLNFKIKEHRRKNGLPEPNSQTGTPQTTQTNSAQTNSEPVNSEQADSEPENTKAFVILESEYKEQFSFLELVRLGNKRVFNHEAFFRFCAKYLRLYRDPNDKNQFLQVKGCFLHIVEEEEILAVVKNYLKEFFKDNEDIVVKNAEGKTIFGKTLTEILCFVDNSHADILRKTTLVQLPTLELGNKLHYNNSEGVVFQFFADLVLKITAEGKQELSYSDFEKLGLYVFTQEISPFAYKKGRADHSDVDKFVKNITRDLEGNLSLKRENWAKLLLGYLCTPISLRTIKNPAVVLSDTNPDGTQAGRTGKGIFSKLVMHYLNPSAREDKLDSRFVSIDGRQINNESRFRFDMVGSNTKILLLNDITKTHGIDQYFVAIEEGLTVEKKGAKKINVRVKLILSTNFSVSVEGASMRDRFWELSLSTHYSDIFKPVDDFGKLLFLDWDEQDWADFSDYMHNCVSFYLAENLKQGGNIIQIEDEVNIQKKLDDLVGLEVLDWADNVELEAGVKGLQHGIRYSRSDLLRSFSEMYPKIKMPASRFLKKIRLLKKFHPDFEDDKVDSSGKREQEGRGTERWVVFYKKSAEAC